MKKESTSQIASASTQSTAESIKTSIVMRAAHFSLSILDAIPPVNQLITERQVQMEIIALSTIPIHSSVGVAMMRTTPQVRCVASVVAEKKSQSVVVKTKHINRRTLSLPTRSVLNSTLKLVKQLKLTVPHLLQNIRSQIQY